MLARAGLPATLAVNFLIVTGFAMVAHSFPVPAPRHQSYQVTLPFIVIAAASFSLLQLVAFTVLIHAAEQLRARRRWYIQCFNVCNYFLSAAAAGVAYRQAVHVLPGSLVAEAEAALAAGCVFVLANRFLLAGALWLARGLSPARSSLFEPELLATDLIITWIAAPMLLLAVILGMWTVLISSGPLFLARPALVHLLEGPAKASQAETRAA